MFETIHELGIKLEFVMIWRHQSQFDMNTFDYVYYGKSILNEERTPCSPQFELYPVQKSILRHTTYIYVYIAANSSVK